ncbi:MAG TPA: hypothetical protein VIY27_09240 [Myxococcota bacterium]
MTGKLSVVTVREYMVECATKGCVGGGYVTSDEAKDKPTATRLFRADGWRKRKAGWVCPECVEGNGPVTADDDDGRLL